MRNGGAFVAALIGVMLSLVAGCSSMSVGDLRCDDQRQVLNVDTLRPRLSWKPASGARGDRPLAYQVLVASTQQLLACDRGDLWDSGKRPVTDNVLVAYDGVPLASGQRAFWKVRLWDKHDGPTAWSEPAQWTMGLFGEGDWQAHWITQGDGPTTRPMPLFRRQFTLATPLSRAVIYICGLGQFELHVNGVRVGNDVLQPGWTNYRKTCLYSAYDVTSLLRRGDNVVGVMLGNGMYDVPAQRYHKFVGSFGAPKLIAQVRLEYADGTAQVVTTDSSWKVAPGPITFSSIYGGEDYDARLEQDGWDRAGFDDSAWSAAKETDGPGGRLVGDSQSAPPIRVAKVLEPVKIIHPRAGLWIYDLGQNCAQIPRIFVDGPAGAEVRLTPGELLGRDGLVSQQSSGKGCYFQYTLKSGGPQTWSPRFCYYGSRYIQVSSDHAKIIYLQGQFVTSSSDQVGEFCCSSDLFNRTAGIIDWAMRNNMMSILTDCPHRERLGWLEQDHLMGPSLMYNFDMQSLLRKICDDMSQAQLPNGMVPDTAPEYTVMKSGFRDSPEWGSAAVVLPWNLYQWYGDLSALREHYDMMRRYTAYLASRATDGIVSHGLGDWFDVGPKPPGIAQLTPIALTATAFYYRDLVILSQTAHLLGKDLQSAEFSRQADSVRDAFNRKFYDSENHRYATGSQTSDALALAMGFVDPPDVRGVTQDLADDVRRRDNSLTAGDVGYRYVLRALADNGRSDVIFDMNSRSDRPGYGWQLAHGATSLTEAWDSSPRASQDHFMLGHIMEWFYTDLAGIQNAEGSVAFRHINIKPAPVGDVTWASAAYDSARGRISSSWRISGHRFTLDVSIPPGCDGRVWVPTSSPETVHEGWGSAMNSDGVRYVGADAGCAVFDVESGSYSFSAD
jgi:hypothetical protein